MSSKVHTLNSLKTKSNNPSGQINDKAEIN